MSIRRIIAVSVAFAGALAVPILAAGPNTAAGEKLFKQRCQACHTIAPGGISGPLAPNLRGVVGRKAGTSAFKTYSPALKASKLVLSQPNLDRFLTAPGKAVPGTRMVIAVADPAQRAAIIAYLAAQR